MNKEMIINLVIGQIGEEKAKEVKGMILGLAGKMNTNDLYIIKKFPNKGVCLIVTNGTDCKTTFGEEAEPKVIELENMLKDIEV
jgi:hypothetical protein